MNQFVKPIRFEWMRLEDVHELDLDHWLAQQKMDGMRCMVSVGPDGVQFYGAGGGKLVQAAAAQHFPALTQALTHDRAPEFIVDAEIMPSEGVLRVFDCPWFPGWADPISTIEERLLAANIIVATLQSDRVTLLPTVTGRAPIWDLLQAAQHSGAEGVVLKRSGSPYPTGDRTKDWLKVKFYREVDCVVLDRNVGACNAILGVYDASGHLITIGSTSMIGKPDAQPGDVVEVKYLSWNPGGALVQPSVLRMREDKPAEDCSIHQLVPAYRDVIEVSV